VPARKPEKMGEKGELRISNGCAKGKGFKTQFTCYESVELVVQVPHPSQ